MKKLYILSVLISTLSFAQIPANYYDSANGLSGYALKSQLKTITTNGHQSRTYDQLYDGDGISGSNGYIDCTQTSQLLQEIIMKMMELFWICIQKTHRVRILITLRMETTNVEIKVQKVIAITESTLFHSPPLTVLFPCKVIFIPSFHQMGE